MDAIYKLQPHRTMALQGFDDYGAAAALTNASDTGFTVSGVFRDLGDFAVLVLHQKDDPFGHPLFSYLPDGDLSGLVLDFDMEWSGTLVADGTPAPAIQAFESKKSPWTDWAYLCMTDSAGNLTQKKLSELATGPSGRTGASGRFTLHASGTQTPQDRATLWYQNQVFDSAVLGTMVTQATFAFYWQSDPSYSHYIQIGTATYSVLQFDGVDLTAELIAENLAGQVNASDPNCAATVSGSSMNLVTLTLRAGVAGPVAVAASDGNGPATLTGLSVANVLGSLRDQINAVNWIANGPVVLTASVDGSDLVITAEPGADGNMVEFYELHKNSNLYFSPTTMRLDGGSSDNVLWHIEADFGALGWNDAAKVWLTFAPALPNSAAYQPTEWQVTFTSWGVSGSGRALKVAGPGSVRIEEDSTWVAATGYWEAAPTSYLGAFGGGQFWSQGRAIRAAASGASVGIETHCQQTHDIYVGTRLDTDCGIVSATLDGGAPVSLDCYSGTPGTSQIRRLLFSGVAAGQHRVVITLTGTKNTSSGGWYFYFDFLECAVRSDVPNPVATTTAVGVSTDFDTDNTYKLSPERVLWNIQKLGLLGEIDHYAGVFWWKQAAASDASYPQCTITFSGTWNDQDVVWLHIGTSAIGKTVFGGMDTNSTIAQHFANFINAIFDGVWASAAGAVLTIKSHSFGTVWQYHVYTSLPGTNTGSGVAAVAGDLQGGSYGVTWLIDPTQTPVLNRAFRDWNSDFFALLAAAGMTVVCSFSQELVQPPDNPGGGAVWVQRFPDGSAAETATGFGTLKSSQIAFSAGPESYLGQAYAAMAGLMVAAGLAPRLQFGEILWWYQANPSTLSGMAFCDADTLAAAESAFGRALASFATPADDPAINGYADANFLRTRLYDFVANIQAAVLSDCPTAVFELLWPMDVNDPDNCRLMRYINLPSQWTARAGSGFDTFVIEGYQYAGVNHNLDQATRCAAYPFRELGWDAAHCRYLMGLYYAGWPWSREFVNASRLGLPLIKLWAYDQVCLFGWPVPLPKNDDISFLY